MNRAPETARVPEGWGEPHSDAGRTPYNLYLREEGGQEVVGIEPVMPGLAAKWAPPVLDRPWMRIEADWTPSSSSTGEAELGPAAFVEMVAIVEDLELRVRYELVEGEPRFVRQSLTPREPQPTEVGARTMRRIGFGGIVEEGFRWLSKRPELFGDAWLQRPRRPGRAGTDLRVYAQWAARYVEALRADPTRPVQHLVEQAAASGEHITAAQVRAYLNRARNRGLLTDAPAGQAGGELTDKARDLLRGVEDATAAARRVAQAFSTRTATVERGEI